MSHYVVAIVDIAGTARFLGGAGVAYGYRRRDQREIAAAEACDGSRLDRGQMEGRLGIGRLETGGCGGEVGP